MSDYIKIGNFTLGQGYPVFIIAEIGVNHNGNVELAKKMIKSAAQCGANCVKFQTFKTEKMILKNAPKAIYQLKNTPKKETQYEMLKKLELDLNSYKEIIQCCRNEGVEFLSTPYSVEDVDFLDSIDIPAFKLASIHAAEPWFAKYVAKKNRPLFLSTGMTTLSEIDITLRSIRDTGNNDTVLLQCTTNYPSRIEDANLLAMKTMSKAFNVLTGYSDHTEDEISSIIAVGLGAKVIEKHFTIDRSLSGPDQSTSFEPEEFSDLVKKIRNAELSLGSPIKEPSEIEKANMQNMRRSLVAKNNINAGKKINEKNIVFMRPGTGISPIFLDEIIGKKIKKNISRNQMIKWSDIED